MNPKAFRNHGEWLVLAKDLQPGDRIKPLFRSEVEEVAAVELYGISASITFVSGAAGSVMNQSQRVALQGVGKVKAKAKPKKPDVPSTASVKDARADAMAQLHQDLYGELDEYAGITPPAPVALWKPHPEHPGTTLPRDWQHPNRPELKGWNWYPVVQHDVEPVHIIQVGKSCMAQVEVCQQDGCWVEGIDYRMVDGGGGYAPGRTGGEHPSAVHAELYGWESVVRSIGRHPESSRNAKDSLKLVDAVKTRIHELRMALGMPAEAPAAPAAPLVPAKPKRQAKRRKPRQLGDLLPGGELVADPANALLELHDQANGAPAPQPAPRVDHVQVFHWPTPPVAVERPAKLWDVVSAIYPTKPQREAAKRRLRTLTNKLQRLPDAERRAFLQHLNTLFP
ncbi:MAG: hypothetical protein QY325_04220 [Flavobacteriales bacterium]|nr:MAG: hypothetical protein QY325_04220 [Flavobacteriales bacterium]